MAFKSLYSSPRWLPRLFVMALVLVSGILTACQPKAEQPLPPAVQIVAQAAPNTSVPPSATLAPTAQPTSTSAGTQSPQRQATTLTILHTNDVMGESAPCG